MSKIDRKPGRKSTNRRQSAERFSCFGPAPLIEGEDAAAYDELLTKASCAVKPRDIIEDMWVRDVVVLEWEARRFRRLITKLVNDAVKKEVHRLLDEELREDQDGNTEAIEDSSSEPVWTAADELFEKWTLRDDRAIKEVEKLLASRGKTMDGIVAEVLLDNLDEIERIDLLIMTFESRRNAVLREVDRHRAAFGQDLRRAADQVEEPRCKLIEQRPTKERRSA
jgi:hypothetical protein